MEEQKDPARCKQCDHLLSFHGEDGCGTWLLGVRAVPLYRCACVVSQSKSPKPFPPTTKFDSSDPYKTMGGTGTSIFYNPPPAEPLRLMPASLNPNVPSHLADTVMSHHSIREDNRVNPEDVLSSLADTLATRDLLQDNDYTEQERQQVISLASSLQRLLSKIQGENDERTGC